MLDTRELGRRPGSQREVTLTVPAPADLGIEVLRVPEGAPVELDLRRFEGMVPVEMLGGVRFPAVGELPYLLTVAGHGFYWLRIPRVHQSSAEPAALEADTEEGGL